MSAERSRVNDPERVIRETFREAGFADGWTDAVLADFAHELAEKIRKQRHESHDHISCIACFIYGEAAALIDPEVLTGE